MNTIAASVAGVLLVLGINMIIDIKMTPGDQLLEAALGGFSITWACIILRCCP